MQEKHLAAGPTLATLGGPSFASPVRSPAKLSTAADAALRATAEAQADALVDLAWKYVFGRPLGSDHPVEIRRALSSVAACRDAKRAYPCSWRSSWHVRHYLWHQVLHSLGVHDSCAVRGTHEVLKDNRVKRPGMM